MNTITLCGNSLALEALAKQIKEGEEVIAAYRTQVGVTLRLAAPEIILQGQRLLAAKDQVKHGEWPQWLKANCPSVRERTARRYMARAAKATLSDYYGLLCDTGEEESRKGESRQWLPYIEILRKFARLSIGLDKCPLTKWPEAGRQKLWEKIEPLVKELRPGLFNES